MLQDTNSICKNKLHFYMPKVNYYKEKFKKNTIYNSIKRMKYVGINLKMKDLYTENCTDEMTPMKETEATNK